jgi:predicted Rdx family selenoprotein
VGSGGVFDVLIDGEFVFRKWEEFRFPDNREILDEIAKRLQKA